MTYIKPEITSNQLSSTRTILKQAATAAQDYKWLEVSEGLKLLPQTNGRPKLFLLNPPEWQIARDLALAMLIEADFQHKWEVAKLLPLFGSQITNTLNDLLHDENIDTEVRWFICKVLGNFPRQEVILSLVALLGQTSDSELIDIAGKTLIKIGDSAIEALVGLLEKPQHRLLAVQALYYIRTAQTITPLLQIATDLDPQLRAIAVKALGSFHDRRIPPVLIAALEDRNSGVRKEAAIALGFRSDLCQELSLITHLQPLLWDLDLEVCRQAAIALGRMKHEAATTALFEVLRAETTPISLKSDLIKALGWSELSLGISYLQQALDTAEPQTSQEIVTVLGRINPPELKPQAAQVLINFGQNHQLVSSGIKQALATSLGELRYNSAQQILTKLAQDSDRKVQLSAQAALRKLA